MVFWFNLPLKLLQSAAKFFKEDNNDDLHHCKEEVCNNWWSTTTMSTLFPQLMETSDPAHRLVFSSSVFGFRSRASASTPWFVSVVEITKGNIQLLHPIFGTPISNVPDNIDLSQFEPCRLATAYHMSMADDINHDDCLSSLHSYTKVLVFSKRSLPCFDNCLLLFLDNWGSLGGYPPIHSWYKYNEEEDGGKETVPWFDISYNSIDRFDDFVTFKDSVRVLDTHGTLYQMSSIIFGGLRKMADSPVCEVTEQNKKWRKRLVASSSGEKLYLVLRENASVLKVYELSAESEMSWNWIEVQSFGDDHQVLFVSRLYCFFVSARDFPGCELGNCIIFSLDAFPYYCSNDGWKYPEPVESEKQIQIYGLLGNDGDTFSPISSYPGFPVNLWSPPSWVLQAAIPPFESQFHSGTRKDEDMQTDDTSSQDEESSVFHGNRSDNSIAKFEGFDVRSDLHPTLQNLWSKHGNIVEKSILCNGDILARALESLAIAILILEQNSARSLSDRQANYLSST